MTPRRLNALIAALFMIGSFGFALGSTGAYAAAVGPTPDAVFLVSSAYAILALGRLSTWRPHQSAWWVAWLNMVGSIAFMASAIGAFVIPRTNTAVDLTVADRGTWVGAVCFFLGALLAIPAFRQAGAAASRGEV